MACVAGAQGGEVGGEDGVGWAQAGPVGFRDKEGATEGEWQAGPWGRDGKRLGADLTFPRSGAVTHAWSSELPDVCKAGTAGGTTQVWGQGTPSVLGPAGGTAAARVSGLLLHLLRLTDSRCATFCGWLGL